MPQQMTGYPSIDKPWLKYYTSEELNTPLPQMTLFQNIWQNNKDHLEDNAIIYFGKKITYGSLFHSIDLCAMALTKYGVKKGDCVTLCTAGVPEAIIIVLACNKLGAMANFLNPLFTAEQMIDRINDTGAKLLFVLDRVYSLVAEALEKTCIQQVIVMPVYQSMPQPMKLLASMQKKGPRMVQALKQGKKHQLWQDFLHQGQNALPKEYAALEVPYQPDAPAVMVYSSGTTGVAKGIVLTNDGINTTISNYKDTDFPYERRETFLSLAPMWASTGIVLCNMMPLCIGVSVIVEPLFDKDAFVNDLKKYRPNMTLASTSFWRYAITSPTLKNVDFSGMRFPATGGEVVRPQDEANITAFLQAHGCHEKLIIGYGMCELGSTVSTTMANHQGKPGSVAIPALHIRVSSFDIKTNQEMPYNRRGEIRVDSPARMLCYYKNPAATDEYFYTDERGVKWGCTGDIGYVDEDGDVFILGRATDSFTTDNGELVYNFDAEAVILQDDRVTACKALGISVDGKMIPVAHIQIQDQVPETFESIVQDIDAQCRKSLPAYAVPVAYKQRSSFPVHPNGKRDNQAMMKERDGFVDGEGRLYKL